MIGKGSNPDFSVLVQSFFCQRLINQRNASIRTVESYRDTFRLLLRYFEDRMHKASSAISLADLDAKGVLAFLDYLEKERHNSIRTRNARLATLRTFLKYAAVPDPASLPTVQQVLAIPMKRFERPLIGFLSCEEIQAILDAPEAASWSGRPDQVMFTTMYNTGARVSEIASLRVSDVSLKPSRTVAIQGKGRKQRVVPLWKRTAALLSQWLKHINRDAQAPLFPNASGDPLTRSGVESRLRQAEGKCLKEDRASPQSALSLPAPRQTPSVP